MEYKNGYEKILDMLPKKNVEAAWAALESGEITVKVVGAKNDGEYKVAAGTAIGAIIEMAGGLAEGKELKGVHFGAPLGGLFTAEELGFAISAESLKQRKITPYSFELRLLGTEVCIVDYMKTLLAAETKAESCGRCVMCREGCKQLVAIISDMTNGKAGGGDLDLLRDVAAGIEDGSYCVYGKGMAKFVLSAMDVFTEEVEGHVRRKRCPALVCSKYVTFHILGNCTACGECVDVCEEDAIDGKPRFIHVINNDDCTKCGKCLAVCPEGAIVKAGAIKPRTPPRPVPVGSWKR